MGHLNTSNVVVRRAVRVLDVDAVFYLNTSNVVVRPDEADAVRGALII